MTSCGVTPFVRPALESSAIEPKVSLEMLDQVFAHMKTCSCCKAELKAWQAEYQDELNEWMVENSDWVIEYSKEIGRKPPMVTGAFLLVFVMGFEITEKSGSMVFTNVWVLGMLCSPFL